MVSIGQFMLALDVLARFAMAYRAIAQRGLVLDQGYGQLIYRFTGFIGIFLNRHVRCLSSTCCVAEGLNRATPSLEGSGNLRTG